MPHGRPNSYWYSCYARLSCRPSFSGTSDGSSSAREGVRYPRQTQFRRGAVSGREQGLLLGFPLERGAVLNCNAILWVLPRLLSRCPTSCANLEMAVRSVPRPWPPRFGSAILGRWTGWIETVCAEGRFVYPSPRGSTTSRPETQGWKLVG